MATLRREAFEKIKGVWNKKTSNMNHAPEENNFIDSMLYDMVDSILELRGFAFLKTDEEQPAYGFDLEESDIAWTIAAEKKVTQKYVNKQAETFDFEEMVCRELARLPYNFEGDREPEKEGFRKFLKAKRKIGQELETWVNWWMSDEWRVANPPWKLTTIKIKWLEAFKVKKESPNHPEYQKFVAPVEEEFIPNPKAKK